MNDVNCSELSAMIWESRMQEAAAKLQGKSQFTCHQAARTLPPHAVSAIFPTYARVGSHQATILGARMQFRHSEPHSLLANSLEHLDEPLIPDLAIISLSPH